MSRKPALLLVPGLVFILFGFAIPSALMLLAPPSTPTADVFARLGAMLTDP